MSYADVNDVKARAGVLASAFREGAAVGPAEIELYLQQTAGELDAYVGSHGFAVPVVDETASAALSSVNADMALLLAVEANWPGSSARDDVADFLTALRERVGGYRTALTAGNLAALLYLGAITVDTEQAGGGAASFWTTDAQSYEWWVAFSNRTWGAWTDPWGVPTTEAPAFHKNMRL